MHVSVIVKVSHWLIPFNTFRSCICIFYATYNMYVYKKCFCKSRRSDRSRREHPLLDTATRPAICVSICGVKGCTWCIFIYRLSADDMSTVHGLPSHTRIHGTCRSPRLRSVHHPVRLPPGEHVKSYYSDKLRRTDFRGPFSRRTRTMELSHTYTVIS